MLGSLVAFGPNGPSCHFVRFLDVLPALLLAIPISVLSGLLSVGPGFLLLPCLILLGVEPKHAAAINAVAVTPPSFSALIPHIGTMRIDPTLEANTL